MKHSWLAVVSCLLQIAVSIQAASADQVVLVNGDRLTGTVLRKESEELILKTVYAGEIKIAWPQVAAITTERPMSLILFDQTEAQSRVLRSRRHKPRLEDAPAKPQRAFAESRSAPPESQAAPAEPPGLAIENVVYINAGPGIGILGVRWKGRINIGAGGSRGNSETDSLHVDGEAVAREQQNRYTLGGALDRGKDRGVISKQSSRAFGKYDRFFGPRWYGYAILTFEKDRFRDIDLRTTVGLGAGHQIIEDERTNLSVEGGLNHVRTDFSLASDESYPGLRLAVKFDHRLFRTDLQLFHASEVLSDVTDTSRTFFKSQTGLRAPLWQRLLATLQFNADYDNAPAPGRAKSDRTYLFTLGYQW